MASIIINSIDSAPANLGGGYYVNESIYIDPVYILKIVWSEDKIMITPPEGSDIYIGSISSLTVNERDDFQYLTDLIDALDVPRSHGRIRRREPIKLKNKK